MIAPSIDHGLAKLKIASAIEQSADLRDRVERATKALIAVVGESSGSVEADWDLEPDAQGRTLLRLRIRDFSGEAVARFAPVEMDFNLQLERRLYSLWGDLLELRSKQYLRDLRETIANLSDE